MSRQFTVGTADFCRNQTRTINTNNFPFKLKQLLKPNANLLIYPNSHGGFGPLEIDRDMLLISANLPGLISRC